MISKDLPGYDISNSTAPSDLYTLNTIYYDSYPVACRYLLNTILDNTELINEQKSKNLEGMFVCAILLGIFGLVFCLWYTLFADPSE